LLDRLAKLKPDQNAVAGVELAAGQLLVCCGDWAAAYPRLEHALKADDPEVQCRARLWLVIARARGGDADAARTALAEARKKLVALRTPALAETARTPEGVQLTWPNRLWRELLLREAEVAASAP
jgi:hypothetical protein